MCGAIFLIFISLSRKKCFIVSSMEARKIPFFNYPALFKADEQQLMSVIRDVCSRGAYILQKDLKEFEQNLQSFLKVKHAIGVADGTNALILGLMAMGIGKGDEVIVPSHTYVASAASIHLVGATPILADCAADHMVDPKSIERRISKRTKALMPVQLNGRTCDMDQILGIAKKHGLRVIEDAAQALGSKFKGKSAGTFGACGTFSFYPAKVLGCFGDGGAVVTNDDEIADKVYKLRDHGRDSSGDVVCWGTNARLDNLQAAILDHKLKSFEKAITRRREIAARYEAALRDISDLTLPPAPEEDRHFDVYQNYELEAGQREKLRAYLTEHGVHTIIQWAGKALHQLKGLELSTEGLPATDRLFARCFMLPMNITLSDDDVTYITDTIRAFYKS